MCFDALFGGGDKETDSTKQLAAQKAEMEAQRRRDDVMRDSEAASARRNAVAMSQDSATKSTAIDDPTKKKKGLKGLSSLRINKTGINTSGMKAGTGLVIGG